MSRLDAVLFRIDAGLDAALERLFARLRLQSISTDPVFAASAAFMTSPVNTLVVAPGRTTCAMVHVLLGEAEAGLEVKKADELRRAVVAAVAERHTPVIVDLVFTVIEEFAAPPRAVDPLVDQACGVAAS